MEIIEVLDLIERHKAKIRECITHKMPCELILRIPYLNWKDLHEHHALVMKNKELVGESTKVIIKQIEVVFVIGSFMGEQEILIKSINIL